MNDIRGNNLESINPSELESEQAKSIIRALGERATSPMKSKIAKFLRRFTSSDYPLESEQISIHPDSSPELKAYIEKRIMTSPEVVPIHARAPWLEN